MIDSNYIYSKNLFVFLLGVMNIKVIKNQIPSFDRPRE